MEAAGNRARRVPAASASLVHPALPGTGTPTGLG